MQHYDLNSVHIVAIVTALICFCGCLFLLVVIYTDNLKRAEWRKRQELEKSLRKELLAAVQKMQEDTYRLVHRDIHDNVGQLLSLAKLNLNTLRSADNSRAKLSATKDLISKAVDELRNIGREHQRDPWLERGLLAGIEYQLEILKKTGAYAVFWICEVKKLTIAPVETIALYRIIQESIQNIIRHAGADVITIIVSRQDNVVQISIADNGRGFDPATRSFREGTGFESMRQRADQIGASLDIISHNCGTSVRLQFNIQP